RTERARWWNDSVWRMAQGCLWRKHLCGAATERSPNHLWQWLLQHFREARSAHRPVPQREPVAALSGRRIVGRAQAPVWMDASHFVFAGEPEATVHCCAVCIQERRLRRDLETNFA